MYPFKLTISQEIIWDEPGLPASGLLLSSHGSRNASLRAKDRKIDTGYRLLTSIATSSAEIAKSASNAGAFWVWVGVAVMAVAVGAAVVAAGAEIAVISINPLSTPALP